jgi:single stranded DNA-binding protein
MNSVNLIGSLLDDPRLDLEGGDEVRCAMRIAVSRRARGGREEPGVVHVDVVALGAQAHECAERLKAGGAIGVTGLIETDEWMDGSGTWRTSQEIVADSIHFLEAPPSAEPERPRRRRRRRRTRPDAPDATP